MDYKQFSQKVKEKYPQYAKIDDYDLATRMVEKYPEYKNKVNFEDVPQIQGTSQLQDVPEDTERSGLSKFLLGDKSFTENIVSGAKAIPKALPYAASEFLVPGYREYLAPVAEYAAGKVRGEDITFPEARERARGVYEQVQQETGPVYAATGMLTGLATGVGAAKGALGTAARKIATTPALQAVEAAAYGAGSVPGEADLGEKAAGAVKGTAALGGLHLAPKVVAGTMKAATKIIGKPYKKAAQMLGSPTITKMDVEDYMKKGPEIIDNARPRAEVARDVIKEVDDVRGLTSKKSGEAFAILEAEGKTLNKADIQDAFENTINDLKKRGIFDPKTEKSVNTLDYMKNKILEDTSTLERSRVRADKLRDIPGTMDDINNYLKKKGYSGDDLLDKIDLADELQGQGARINKDGTVELYHFTDPKSASEIKNTGKMTAKEDGIFFSTSPSGQAVGYGDEKIRMNVPIDELEIDDIFGNEAHVRIPLKRAGEVIDVNKYTTAALSQGAEEFNPIKMKIAGEFDELDRIRKMGDLEGEYNALKQMTDDSPLYPLRKYVDKSTGSLPEVTGYGKNLFSREGDQIAQKMGYPDSETLRLDFDNYMDQVDRMKDVAELSKKPKNTIRNIEIKLAELKGKAAGAKPEMTKDISLENVKTLIQTLDEQIAEAQKFGVSGRVETAKKTLRSQVDEMLKAKSPEYRKAMFSINKDMEVLKDIKLDYKDADTMVSKLQKATRDEQSEIARRFQVLDEYTGKDYTEQFKNSMLKEKFMKQATHGSRKTVAGGAMGAGLGSAVGGYPGAVAGSTIGSALGYAADVHGPGWAKKMLNGLIYVEDALKRNPTMLGKYGKVFAGAAGDEKALAATHYILYKKSADYRKMIADNVEKDKPGEEKKPYDTIPKVGEVAYNKYEAAN